MAGVGDRMDRTRQREHQQETLTFLAANVTKNLTDQATTTVATANAEYVMPKAGSVRYISVASNDARTAGTAAFQVAVDATGCGSDLTATLNAATPQYPYATVGRGTNTFAAGQKITVTYTSSSDFAPDASADVVILVGVEY